MKSNLSIIDADSLIYLVGSKYKDVRIRSSALNDLDNFIIHILTVNYSKHYIGFFGKRNGKKNFRYGIAKTKPYKGTRPEKADWYKYWEKIMKTHMEKVWGFIPVEHVEADDMCTFYATKYKGSKNFDKIVVCSPDKDLKQVGGVWHYDYWKRESKFISVNEGIRRLYGQCIEGDGTDNILGLMGCGEGAAKKFMAKFDDSNIDDIHEAIKIYYKNYLHVEYPAKMVKAAEKAYLSGYKISKNIKRFNKKTKAEALQTFNKGGKMFKPLTDDYYLTQFNEMYNLVYMLRTEDEIKKYWPEYVFTEPMTEDYIDWDEVDINQELLHGDVEEEDFEEDLTFLRDDDFDDLDDLNNL